MQPHYHLLCLFWRVYRPLCSSWRRVDLCRGPRHEALDVSMADCSDTLVDCCLLSSILDGDYRIQRKPRRISFANLLTMDRFHTYPVCVRIDIRTLPVTTAECAQELGHCVDSRRLDCNLCRRARRLCACSVQLREAFLHQ